MAHGLFEYDWMLSAKERPWHGIGTVVEEALGMAVKYMGGMDAVAEEMYAKKINEEKFEKNFSEKLKALTYSDKSNAEIINRIHLIYNEKDDLQNFKGTAWGMYNAVADFVSNTAPLRQTKNSGEIKLAGFFDGNKLLQVSQDLLMVA